MPTSNENCEFYADGTTLSIQDRTVATSNENCELYAESATLSIQYRTVATSNENCEFYAEDATLSIQNRMIYVYENEGLTDETTTGTKIVKHISKDSCLRMNRSFTMEPFIYDYEMKD